MWLPHPARTRPRYCGWPGRSKTPPGTRSPQRSPHGARKQLGTGLPGVQGFTSDQGLGVSGVVSGHAVVAGRRDWIEDQWAQPIPAGLAARAAGAEAAGQTAVFTGWDGQVRGVLVVADTIKPTSAEAVARLREMRPVAGAAHRRQRPRRPRGR